MKLYEFMQVTQRDYDCYDTEQDMSVTVCWIGKIESDYDKFCVELLKKVELVKQTNDITLVCDWSKLIKDNYDKFKAFTASEWETDFEDKNDFVYQWIKELHYYVAGEMPEDYYGKLYEFIHSLEEKSNIEVEIRKCPHCGKNIKYFFNVDNGTFKTEEHYCEA